MLQPGPGGRPPRPDSRPATGLRRSASGCSPSTAPPRAGRSETGSPLGPGPGNFERRVGPHPRCRPARQAAGLRGETGLIGPYAPILVLGLFSLVTAWDISECQPPEFARGALDCGVTAGFVGEDTGSLIPMGAARVGVFPAVSGVRPGLVELIAGGHTGALSPTRGRTSFLSDGSGSQERSPIFQHQAHYGGACTTTTARQPRAGRGRLRPWNPRARVGPARTKKLCRQAFQPRPRAINFCVTWANPDEGSHNVADPSASDERQGARITPNQFEPVYCAREGDRTSFYNRVQKPPRNGIRRIGKCVRRLSRVLRVRR